MRPIVYCAGREVATSILRFSTPTIPEAINISNADLKKNKIVDCLNLELRIQVGRFNYLIPSFLRDRNLLRFKNFNFYNSFKNYKLKSKSVIRSL